jgi:hypothetical protein
VTALGTITTLQFSFQQDPAYLHLDDVSVTVTPIPSAFPLFATGLGLLGFVGWRRNERQRQSRQRPKPPSNTQYAPAMSKGDFV